MIRDSLEGAVEKRIWRYLISAANFCRKPAQKYRFRFSMGEKVIVGGARLLPIKKGHPDKEWPFVREPNRQVFTEAMPVPFVATDSLELASRFQLAG